jgi:hypothetical protein
MEQTRRQAKRRARQGRQMHEPDAASVRFSGERNIVAAATIDQPASAQRSVAIQSTSIDQDGHAA